MPLGSDSEHETGFVEDVKEKSKDALSKSQALLAKYKKTKQSKTKQSVDEKEVQEKEKLNSKTLTKVCPLF